MALVNGGTFTVANGATLSTQNDLGIVDRSSEVVGFQIDGTIVSNSMSFKASVDGSTFQPLNDQGGTLISVTIKSNETVGLNQDKRAQIGRWRYLQILMGSTETNGATIKTLWK